MRQISKYNARKASRANTIKSIETHLEQHTHWGKYMARPAQVRAGARKLFDVAVAQVRREQKQAVQG